MADVDDQDLKEQDDFEEDEHEEDAALALNDEDKEEPAATDEEPKAAVAEAPSTDDQPQAAGDDKKVSRRQRRAQNRFRTLLRQNSDVRAENEAIKAQYEHERQAREALEVRLAKLEQSQNEAQAASIEEQISSAKQQLRKAVDDGETDRQLELMERLVELKVKKAEPPAPAPAKTAPPAQPSPGPDRSALDEWLLNNSWFHDPQYGHYAAMAQQLEQSLLQQGYTGFSQELFNELDKRLDRAAPEVKALRDSDDEEEEEEKPPVPVETKPKRPATVVSGAPKQPARRRPRSNGFDEQDKATMSALREQGFPLDPNDPKHREAWQKYAKRSLDDEKYY